MGNTDIPEKMADFERLPKIFEMNDPKITLPFDSEPKIPNFFSQMDRAPGRPVASGNFPVERTKK